MHSEYGGYLPLERAAGEERLFSVGEENILRTNSAKAALHYALEMRKVKKLYTPYYMCRSVTDLLKNSGISLSFYYLQENLLPDLKDLPEDAWVLLVNYFGIMEEDIRDLVREYPHVIIDNSHALFVEPILEGDTCCIYSCRKFIGVPDGGYLIGQGAGSLHLEPCQVRKHFSYLVDSFEADMNSSYRKKLESDMYLAANLQGMSELTRAMLPGIDFERIRQQRLSNFAALNRLLGPTNAIKFPEETYPAYLYPYLPVDYEFMQEDQEPRRRRRNQNSPLKKALLREQIYIPTLWKELLTERFRGTLEYRLSSDTIFLPVDQRYDTEDMEYLAGRVEALIGEVQHERDEA